MGETGLSADDEQLFKEMGYSFSRQIGSGSYAKVFLAEKRDKENTTKKLLACKIINAANAPKEFTTKFLPRELDILAKVNHPNIIFIQGIFRTNANILIFMQNADRGDLLEFILSQQEITEEAARTWCHQLTVALQYLHALQISHRDIKCENVLITKHMNAKLADFGFARFVSTERERNLPSRTYCGSIAYTAPEVMRGKPYWPKIADIWSLGVVVYVLLNRSLPFPMDKIPPKGIYKMQKEKKWKFRSRAIEKFSTDAQDMVTSMLEPEVRKRPTANDLLLSSWFTIQDTNGARNSIELTKYEKVAYECGLGSVKLPPSDTVQIETNKFNLMENEKEPFPSENNLILSLSVNRIHEEELDSKKDIPSRPALEKIPSTMDVKQAENDTVPISQYNETAT